MRSGETGDETRTPSMTSGIFRSLACSMIFLAHSCTALSLRETQRVSALNARHARRRAMYLPSPEPRTSPVNLGSHSPICSMAASTPRFSSSLRPRHQAVNTRVRLRASRLCVCGGVCACACACGGERT
jgi:hypothetical protein